MARTAVKRLCSILTGVSLAGASMESDDDANKALYNKVISASHIVAGLQTEVPASGKPLVELLDKTSPART